MCPEVVDGVGQFSDRDGALAKGTITDRESAKPLTSLTIGCASLSFYLSGLFSVLADLFLYARLKIGGRFIPKGIGVRRGVSMLDVLGLRLSSGLIGKGYRFSEKGLQLRKQRSGPESPSQILLELSCVCGVALGEKYCTLCGCGSAVPVGKSTRVVTITRASLVDDSLGLGSL